MKWSTLKRYTPIRKRRATPRRGEPTKQEKAQIRETVYELSVGMCELRLLPGCLKGPLPYQGGLRERWHLVHLHAKRRFGWGLDNLCGGCAVCHLDGMHGQGLKPPQITRH